MRKVLLDTVGLLALWNQRDQWNQAAAPVFDALVGEGAEFYTTEYIPLECGNAASRTRFRSDVVELRDQLLDDRKLIAPTADDCIVAWNSYKRGDAGEAGIVDLVSFAVMRRLGISEAFTNDKHFAAAGFLTLF
jgi:predicted nucleic acid-binding protein